jgi:hypothetical protein
MFAPITAGHDLWTTWNPHGGTCIQVEAASDDVAEE